SRVKMIGNAAKSPQPLLAWYVSPGLRPAIYTDYSIPGGTGGMGRKEEAYVNINPFCPDFPAGPWRRRRRAGPATWDSALIRGNAGLLDHPGPQGDVGLDDVGEGRERRALGLAAGGVELLAHLWVGKRRLQRLVDALDDRLRRRLGHHDPEPRRHLRL